MLEIALDLNTYCIETAAKRAHNRCLSAYFRSKGDDRELEDQLILLEEALKRFDFSALRSTYSELAGNSRARVILADLGKDCPGISIDGSFIDLSTCLRED